ncbi:bifunctional (p)ppGpp synthetase/guanosine-3',5'-bis(diphosphate) 3'-pyrophosphohydrolase [Rickettsia endosymbiont of Ceutorhynchus obstrictus]|uniref:bifunctional (p)ppGpp synthetase/guanosine-3',5'-bis(diphosphate) 3'-pyrophosphohydrolase n=1 Tax=Rickettsia endosymbiont of Ceutorhynchus obstrictus TaxID=3066249 RepID=UPI003133450D
MVDIITCLLHEDLLKHGIKAEISGRIKEPESILRKIIRKETTLEQLTDIIAFRVIVADKKECYKARDIIYKLYNVDLQKSKNFIDSPKENGYQSLHIVIEINPYKRKIEIQIRTVEMHEQAETGKSAHWQYKFENEEKFQRIGNSSILLRKVYEAIKQNNCTENDLLVYEKALRATLNYMVCHIQDEL